MERKKMALKRLQAFCCAVVCLWMCSFQSVLAEGTEIEIKEPEQLYAQSAVLMDADSGRILFAKNSQEERPMASTTKIMTCILALEQADLDAQAEVSANAASQPEVHLGVQKGQKFRVGDLLYSLMLESHNDAAVILAEYVGGSVEGFAGMMNAKAKEIGCDHTYFITPNGLDAQNEEGVHHTTAEDLAKIMRYCILDSPKADDFLKITQTDHYSFKDIEGNRDYSCSNHNAFLKMMDGALSGKTGFTNEAGYCYVGALEQDGKELIVALLACGWPNHKTYKWRDTRELMEYGLSSFEVVTLSKQPKLSPIPVIEGIAADSHPDSPAEVEIAAEGNPQEYKTLLRKDQQVEMRTELPEVLNAPVEKGLVVGKIQYFCEGVLLYETDIKTCQSVEEKTFFWCLGWVIRHYSC